MTIFSKSIGCTACDGTVGFGIVHMIRPDYTEYVDPHYSLLIDDDSHFNRLCSYSFDDHWNTRSHLTAGDFFFDEFWKTTESINELNETKVNWSLELNPSETVHKGCALFAGNYTTSRK